jgi:NADH:ubiquinone oxidoreductase subunit
MFQNFWNSLRPRQLKGTYVGEDYLGNKYYEIPPQPHLGKNRPTRWFEAEGGEMENLDKELTAEWEAWLRGRRY